MCPSSSEVFMGSVAGIGTTLPCCGIPPSPQHLSLEVELEEVLTLTGL